MRLTDEARAAGTTSSDLARIIAEKVAWANTASGMFASDTLVGYAMMVVVIGGAVMGVFALLLFAIALIICTHTVSTSIEEGYADYGTLKALGLPNRALRGMLVVEYAGVSLAGLAVGLTLGSVLVPFALPFFAQLTCVLASNAAPPAAAIALLAVLLALVAAVVALKTGKLARISPLVAFRGGAADVRFRSRGERPLGGSHLSLQLAVRAIMSAKRRYVGLAGCACVLCAFIVLVFGIGGTLRGENAAQDAFGMWESDLSITLASPDVDFAEVERVIEEASPIEKSWQEAFTMVSFGGESHSFAGLSDLTLVQGVTEGCLPAHDNEALIGVNLAKSMDLRVGDELVVDGADGEERRFVVCGLLSAMFNAGSGTILTYDGVRDLAGTAEEAAEPSRQYQLADPGAADEARAAVESRFGDAVDTRSTGMFEMCIRDSMSAVDFEAARASRASTAFDASRRRLLAEGVGADDASGYARYAVEPPLFDPGRVRATFVSEGDEVAVGRFRFRVIEVPGHTPGHLALFEPDSGVLFGGDHVLFVISPGIALFPDGADALQAYLDSLAKVRALGCSRLFVSHGEPRDDFAERIDWLDAHHRERLEEAAGIVAAGPGLTGEQVIRRIKWNVPHGRWEDISFVQRWCILMEGLVILDHLVDRGRIRREEDEDGLRRYF